MKNTAVLVVVAIAALLTGGAGQHRVDPCPVATGNTGRPAELVMAPDDFNAQAAGRALAFLETDLPGLVEQAESVDRLLADEHWAIGFPNAVTRLKGRLLKLELENARLALQLARVEKQPTGAATRRLEIARRAWCAFLSDAATAVD